MFNAQQKYIFFLHERLSPAKNIIILKGFRPKPSYFITLHFKRLNRHGYGTETADWHTEF